MEITIYTQAGRACPYCDKAKELLSRKGHGYVAIPLERDPLLALAAKYNHNTVPMILNGETLIGGFSELQAYLSA